MLHIRIENEYHKQNTLQKARTPSKFTPKNHIN